MNLENTRAKRNKQIAIVLKYFGVIMAIFYIVMGTAFLVFPPFVNYAGDIRYAVASLLFLYGCFRVYRLIRFIKTQNNNIEVNETVDN